MKKYVFRITPLFVFFFYIIGLTSLPAAEVSLGSLLDEMVDRDAITRFPAPFYSCKQASSYDRKSTDPNVKTNENWLANGDWSQFVRDEKIGNRTEHVLIDEKGPGSIVRVWITSLDYSLVLRVYVDGNSEPVLEAPCADLVGGSFLVDSPLSAVRARGCNLYLPIPYAKNIKITVENTQTDPKVEFLFYYQVTFRAYEPGTKVESFTMEGLKSLQSKIEQVQKTLLTLPLAEETKTTLHQIKKFELAPDGSTESFSFQQDGPGAVSLFALRVDAAADLPQALRSTLLELSFDGNRTVRVPLGDFFGGGIGINPYQTWYTKVYENGALCCFWKMPFKNKFEATFTNVNPNPKGKVAISGTVQTQPYSWDERSMYFYANWRQQRDIKTFGGDDGQKEDWNYGTFRGKGVFVGDSLSLVNPSPRWWGEGDEKIFVDGEKFPSTFGTGTEDYYGYAWCTSEFFEAPFHAQPRAEGPRRAGNVTNDRFRLLDGIPFTTHFRFDMEIWHMASTSVDYSAVMYLYGFPTLEGVDGPTGKFPSDEEVIAEMKSPVSYKMKKSLNPLRIAGLDIKSAPTGGALYRQTMLDCPAGKWENDDQLWWKKAKPGDKLELNATLSRSGPFKLICFMTKANDYGIVQFYFDGQKVGKPVDLYDADDVVSTGAYPVGSIDSKEGQHVITVEIVGKNPKSKGYMFGLDKFLLE